MEVLDFIEDWIETNNPVFTCKKTYEDFEGEVIPAGAKYTIYDTDLQNLSAHHPNIIDVNLYLESSEYPNNDPDTVIEITVDIEKRKISIPENWETNVPTQNQKDKILELW